LTWRKARARRGAILNRRAPVRALRSRHSFTKELPMANITRFPWPAEDAFEDAFKRFFRPARWMPDAVEPQIKVDVEESDESYAVKAEVPGVKKDDINVQIDGDMVTIAAEVKREKDEKKGARVLRSERYYGAVQRSFSLGHEVDAAAASAKYDNGVLQLLLPKKAGGASKKIAVQ
jgi:HSP20 family protein